MKIRYLRDSDLHVRLTLQASIEVVRAAANSVVLPVWTEDDLSGCAKRILTKAATTGEPPGSWMVYFSVFLVFPLLLDNFNNSSLVRSVKCRDCLLS